MNRIKALSALACLGLLAGCSIQDICTQEAAIPLRQQGRHREIAAYGGTGPDPGYYFDPQGSGSYGMFTAVKIAVPLSQKADLSCAVSTSGFSVSAKGGAKFLILNKGKYYLAAAPAVFFSCGGFDYSYYFPDVYDNGKLWALGVGLQAISTWEVSRGWNPPWPCEPIWTGRV